MFQRNRSGHQIKCTRTDPLALLSERMAKPRTLTSGLGRECQHWDILEEGIELLNGNFSIRASEPSLKCLHIGDDRDTDPERSELFEQLRRASDFFEMIDDDVGVNEIGHISGRTSATVLPSLCGKISQQLIAINPTERASTLVNGSQRPLRVVVFPDFLGV